jgi:hypothetical protein
MWLRSHCSCYLRLSWGLFLVCIQLGIVYGSYRGVDGEGNENVGHELIAMSCGISFPSFRWLERR